MISEVFHGRNLTPICGIRFKPVTNQPSPTTHAYMRDLAHMSQCVTYRWYLWIVDEPHLTARKFESRNVLQKSFTHHSLARFGTSHSNNSVRVVYLICETLCIGPHTALRNLKDFSKIFPIIWQSTAWPSESWKAACPADWILLFNT